MTIKVPTAVEPVQARATMTTEERAAHLSLFEDRVLVQRDVAVNRVGKIDLPDQAQIRPHIGTVLRTGPGRTLQDGSRAEMPLKVGDRVAFPSYAGIIITKEELGTTDDLLTLRVEEILWLDSLPPPSAK